MASLQPAQNAHAPLGHRPPTGHDDRFCIPSAQARHDRIGDGLSAGSIDAGQLYGRLRVDGLRLGILRPRELHFNSQPASLEWVGLYCGVVELGDCLDD